MTTNPHLFSLMAAETDEEFKNVWTLSLPHRAEFDSGLKESERVKDRQGGREKYSYFPHTPERISQNSSHSKSALVWNMSMSGRSAHCQAD